MCISYIVILLLLSVISLSITHKEFTLVLSHVEFDNALYLQHWVFNDDVFEIAIATQHTTASSADTALVLGGDNDYNENEEIEWNAWSEKMKLNEFVTKYKNHPNYLAYDFNAAISIRKQIFIARLRKISLIRRRLSENIGFSVGMNPLSMLTNDERKKLTGLIPIQNPIANGSTESPTFKSSLVNDFTKDEEVLGESMNIGSSFPEHVDWRVAGAVTDVKIQGLCGACWAFAATGLLESLFHKRHGYLLTFSEQELIDCDRDHNKGCSGGNFYFTLNDYYIKRFAGISLGMQYPYSSYDKKSSSPIQPYNEYKCNELAQTAKLGNPTVKFLPQKEDALVEAISRGPVPIAISGYSDIFQFYTGGVIDSDDCGTFVDHAVLAIGYTSEYFIIKNSWGPQWGENGYAKIKRGPGKSGLGYCGIYSQINELDFTKATSNIECNLSSTTQDGKTNSTLDSCKQYQSSRFCTQQYGCQNSSFYDGSLIPSSGLLSNSSTLSPSSENEKNQQTVQSVLIFVVVFCAFLSIVLLIGIIILYKRQNPKPKKLNASPSANTNHSHDDGDKLEDDQDPSRASSQSPIPSPPDHLHKSFPKHGWVQTTNTNSTTVNLELKDSDQNFGDSSLDGNQLPRNITRKRRASSLFSNQSGNNELSIKIADDEETRHF